MKTSEPIDGEIDAAETEGTQTTAATDEMPDRFRFLDEQERVQGLRLRKLFAEQEHGLRQKYADWILLLLAAQFLVADAVFVAIAWAGRGWDLSPGLIEVWLAATVVQMVGVAAVVTRSLFPGREVGA